jgi:hypothetical protein
MGRAFRVVKRTAHLTVRVAERPVQIAAAGGAAPARGAKRPATRQAAKKKSPGTSK